MLEAKELRARARQTLEGNWGPAILVCFLGVLLGGLTGTDLLQVNYDSAQGWSVEVLDAIRFNISNMSVAAAGGSIPYFGRFLPGLAAFAGWLSIAQFIIGGAVELGICKYFIGNALCENPDWREEFSYFNYFGKALALRLVRSIFIFLWTLLFIIPGIIAAYRYSMASYILAENPEMDFMDALRQSSDMMDGYKGDKFWLDLTFLGWAILATLALGLGFILLNPYISATEAHFYLNLKTVISNRQQPYGSKTQDSEWQQNNQQ